MIYKNLTELVGNTPLVELQRLAEAKGAQAQVVAKVEYFNPGCSVKDRIALNMIEDAERRARQRHHRTDERKHGRRTGLD